MKSVSSFGWRGFLFGLASVVAVGVGMPAARGQPVVTNVTAAQTPGQREVIISYQLSHPQSAWCEVVVKASRDAGTTWEVLNAGLSGTVGRDVATTPTPATKTITWQLASTQWPGKLFPQVQIDVVVDDTNGMAVIPAGTFTMGSVVASIVGTDKSDQIGDATPHAVTLSAFYLAKTETTYTDWIAVRTWARDAARGAGVYDFGATLGGGKGDTHPVHSVSWYDVVKWCNAKSEREGLTPVYYTNDAQTLVHRTGNVDVTAAQVKWGANGYRLPTEAEWEYAARGGLSGQRFPWGDTITHVQANYPSNASYAYDVSTMRGYHPTYATGAQPYTSPVGVFAANGYGLSDMVGNVWEWTWDVYGSYGSGAVTDPRGAASGTLRVYRGGSWLFEADYARLAGRGSSRGPGNGYNSFGFRPARSLEAPGVPTNVSAVGGNGQAVVSFSPPSSVGWSVITGYTVKATLPSGEVMSATGASSPITVSGLMNGGLYTFTVAATNSGGTGAASAASVAVQTAGPEMALIPAGSFTMGSVVASIAGADKSDGVTNATPHAVTLSAFYLAKTETTYGEWVGVRTWARDAARGAGVYDFGATLGGGKGDTHPVHSVSWYDVVKWCNAKSEREGLTPVYYTNDAQTAGYVYRTGNVAVTNTQVKWGANGYRLPTEAEWEYAARGGASGQRFPWGDTITHAQANYSSSASYAYDVSTTRGNQPTYGAGTSPVGVFAANGYGLSDMAGNVWEWTWDVYGSYGSGVVTDPRGAASGTNRVGRGGSWGNGANYARSADRDYYGSDDRFISFGFRPARSSVP
jgi:sulfatase modifying factor 1